jgi:chorismate lyase
MIKPAAPPMSTDARFQWRARTPFCTTQNQRHWLKRPGALTVGLRQLGPLTLTVHREAVVRPSPDEARALGIARNEAVWVREISMAINNTIAVAARTVCALEHVRGSWNGLRHIAIRPLADLLYDDYHVKRSAFESARLYRPHPLARLSINVQIKGHREAFEPNFPTTANLVGLLARRSLFWRHDAPLLVSECFLPSFWWICKHGAHASAQNR